VLIPIPRPLSPTTHVPAVPAVHCLWQLAYGDLISSWQRSYGQGWPHAWVRPVAGPAKQAAVEHQHTLAHANRHVITACNSLKPPPPHVSDGRLPYGTVPGCYLLSPFVRRLIMHAACTASNLQRRCLLARLAVPT